MRDLVRAAIAHPAFGDDMVRAVDATVMTVDFAIGTRTVAHREA